MKASKLKAYFLSFLKSLSLNIFVSVRVRYFNEKMSRSFSLCLQPLTKERNGRLFTNFVSSSIEFETNSEKILFKSIDSFAKITKAVNTRVKGLTSESNNLNAEYRSTLDEKLVN